MTIPEGVWDKNSKFTEEKWEDVTLLNIGVPGWQQKSLLRKKEYNMWFYLINKQCHFERCNKNIFLLSVQTNDHSRLGKRFLVFEPVTPTWSYRCDRRVMRKPPAGSQVQLIGKFPLSDGDKSKYAGSWHGRGWLVAEAADLPPYWHT